jgi:TetR/AcrR family transcriptional regulator, cholesterol catabolism regulator
MCNYAWTWYRPDGPQSVEEIAGRFARELLGGLTGPGEADSLDERIAEAIATVQRAPGRLPAGVSLVVGTSGTR